MTKPSQHVIYVPGIGDYRSFGQKIAIHYWRLFGLHPHYLPLGWQKQEGFDAMLGGPAIARFLQKRNQ